MGDEKEWHLHRFTSRALVDFRKQQKENLWVAEHL